MRYDPATVTYRGQALANLTPAALAEADAESTSQLTQFVEAARAARPGPTPEEVLQVGIARAIRLAVVDEKIRRANGV